MDCFYYQEICGLLIPFTTSCINHDICGTYNFVQQISTTRDFRDKFEEIVANVYKEFLIAEQSDYSAFIF